MRKTEGNIVEERIIQILSEGAWSRLCNLKAVDLERYYKIEQILYGVSKSGGTRKITDEEFLKIIQTTEKPVKKFVYRSRSDLFDDFD